MPRVTVRPARAAVPLAVALLLAAASGCAFGGGDEGGAAPTGPAQSAGDTDSPAPPPAVEPMAADGVCGGTLSPEAAGALELLTGATEFVSTGGLGTGGSDAGPAHMASYAERLLTSEAYYDDFCHILLPGEEESFARIAFGLRDTAAAPEVPGPMEVRYAAGDYAYATDASAIVVFPCPGAGPGYVEANLYTSEDTPQTRDAQITVATSVARALADELGCLDASGLPEGVPGRTAQD